MAKENEAGTEPEAPEDQLEVMDDVLDATAPDEEAPADEPKEQEPEKGAPPKDDKAEAAKPADGTDEPKPEQAQEPKEKEKEAKAEDKDDPEFEMAGKDGVRKVKLSALKTTYQQHGALQAKHEAVKPFFDLSKASGIPVDKMFQFAVIGIQTVHEASQRKQEPAGSAPQPKPGGYEGPFQSQQQEDELKESDPILYSTTKALWDQNRSMRDQVFSLIGKLEQQQARAAQPTPPTGGAQPSPELQRVDGLISGVQKAHDAYFKKHPERTEAFKNYLGSKFSSVPLNSVDDSFIAFAFQTFDPVYYAAWQEDQMRAKMDKARLTQRRTFGEQDSVRGSVSSSVTEQQEAMADILNF